MDGPPVTIMSPKAAILQKLVVVTSHMYIPAFGSSYYLVQWSLFIKPRSYASIKTLQSN